MPAMTPPERMFQPDGDDGFGMTKELPPVPAMPTLAGLGGGGGGASWYDMTADDEENMLEGLRPQDGELKKPVAAMAPVVQCVALTANLSGGSKLERDGAGGGESALTANLGGINGAVKSGDGTLENIDIEINGREKTRETTAELRARIAKELNAAADEQEARLRAKGKWPYQGGS